MLRNTHKACSKHSSLQGSNDTEGDLDSEDIPCMDVSLLKDYINILPLDVLSDILDQCLSGPSAPSNKSVIDLLATCDEQNDNNWRLTRKLRWWSDDSDRLLEDFDFEEMKVTDHESLEKGLTDDCIMSRLTAIHRLSRHPNRILAFQMIGSLGIMDQDVDVRMTAIRAILGFLEFAPIATLCLLRKDESCPISGVFVHAIEDEYFQVRCQILDVLQGFACQNLEFAKIALDHMTDMINDEIEAVRVKAIDCIRYVLVSVPSLNKELNDVTSVMYCLEDRSFEVRYAFRKLLEETCVPSSRILSTLVIDGLLKNLKRYGQDRSMIWDCAAKLGRNHEAMASLLYHDFLCLHDIFDTAEKDLTDHFYMTVLIFLVNGLYGSGKTDVSDVVKLPDHFKTHVSFLCLHHPQLVPPDMQGRPEHSQQSSNDRFVRPFLERVLDLCEIGDSFDSFTECAEKLDDAACWHSLSRFYADQCRLLAACYRSRQDCPGFDFNIVTCESLRFHIFELLCRFDGFNDTDRTKMVSLAKAATSKDEPLSFFRLSELSSVFCRTVEITPRGRNDVELPYSFPARSIYPFTVQAKLQAKNHFDVYCCILYPDGVRKVTYIPPRCYRTVDNAFNWTATINYSLLLTYHTSWTEPGVAQLTLGCVLDDAFASELLESCSDAPTSTTKALKLRYHALTEPVSFRMEVHNILH